MAEQKIKGVKKFFEEFKAFAMRGNVLDMAVGVVVGSAFTAIVNSLVGDVINPLIGLFFNNDFSEVVVKIGGVDLKIGSFISAIINFLIVAFVLFLVLKAFNAVFNKKKEEAEEAPAEPTTKVCPLLPERDLHQGRALPPVHLQAGRLPRDQRLSSLKKHSAPVHCKIAVSGGAFL